MSRKSQTIPGPLGCPLIGNVGKMNEDQVHVSLYNLQRDHGDLFQISLFGNRLIGIGEISLMEKAFAIPDLCHRSKRFLSRLKYNSGYLYVERNYNEREVRWHSILLKAISAVTDNPVLTRMLQEERENFLTSLEETGEIYIKQCLYQTAARLHCIFIAGIVPEDKHTNAVLEYLDSINNIYKGGKLTKLSALPWLRHIPGPYKTAATRIKAARNRLAETLVADARKNRESSPDRGILQCMMSAEPVDSKDNVVTHQSLVACTMDLLFNGLDPLPSNIAYIILQSIKQPQMQQKIHDELDGVLRDPQDYMNVRREQVPYLEAFILECMRCLSHVFISFAHLVGKDTEVDGYVFPKGYTVLGNQFSLHHDEKRWDKPWDFKPDRFLDERGNSLSATHPLWKQLCIFGVGLRKCPGQRIASEDILRLTLGIFSRYKVLPPVDSDLPSTDPRDYNTVVALVIPDFKCRFEKKIVSIKSSILESTHL